MIVEWKVSTITFYSIFRPRHIAMISAVVPYAIKDIGLERRWNVWIVKDPKIGD